MTQEHIAAYGCSCEMCRARRAAYARKLRRMKQDGVPRLVPTDVAREHVQKLSNLGMGNYAIALDAGVSEPTVARVLNNPGNGRITPATEKALLSARFTTVNLKKHTKIDVTGTRRRLEALVCLGWNVKQIADRMGVEHGGLVKTVSVNRWVTVERADAVKAVYDELWDQGPPEEVWQQYSVARRTRAWASRKGFFPPAAWDDDTIDDPDAMPDVGEKVRQNANAREEIAFLRSFGKSNKQIAAQLGKSTEYIRKILEAA